MSFTITDFIDQYIFNNEKGFGVYLTRYLLAGCVVILMTFWLRWKKVKSPPGPVGVPILGYLPFLTSEPYKGLHKLKDKYGSIFGLYMGRTYVVILADYSAVKEAFSKSSTVDRPESVFDFIPDGVGFSSVNGQEWVEQRRYSVRLMHSLGLGKDEWESLVQDEVEDFLDLISSRNGLPFDICSHLTASVSNNIATLVFGKRISLDDKSREFLNESINASSQFASQFSLRSSFPAIYDTLTTVLGFSDGKSQLKQLADFNQFVSSVRILRWQIAAEAVGGLQLLCQVYDTLTAAFGFFDGKSQLKQLVDFNCFVRDQVKEHERQNTKENDCDFINGYLLKMKENKELNLGNTFNEKNLYGNIQALFIGASDTTRTSLNWLFITMATYQDTQSKVQEELDRVLDTEGKIYWSERASLPYTYATIMEGQRWKTVAPLNTARIATEDIKLGGYDILKGTTIIANNWGIHNDTRYWKNPEKFLPERFLSGEGKKVNFKPESYVPFSYGKRNCPGETVAMIEILHYFTAILQKFRVLPPEGQEPNLEGTLGLTYQAVEQDLRFIKRI